MLITADIFEAISGIRPSWADQAIDKAVVDSREAGPDSLFVALPGERFDGHDFVSDAFNRGACLALIQHPLSGEAEGLPVIDLRNEAVRGGLLSGAEPPVDPNNPYCLLVADSLKALQAAAGFWRRKLSVKVVGITGSVGKSTTKEVTAEVLSRRFSTLKNPGNLNNEIGLPLTLLRLNESHERAVLEMGFYVPGEIQLLCKLALPQIGVITNIDVVHAERAGSMEAIVRGKAELVEALPPDGVAILNYDDPLVRSMADLTKARVFFYGMDPAADLWADNIEGLGLEGIRFQLHYRGETIHLRVPLIGRHSVHTVLRAASVGLVDGLSWQGIVSGLRSEKAQLRLVTVRHESGALILDDTYNASPQSTLAALNLLEELDGRKIAVLGDMLELGPYETQGHEMVGMRAAEVVDQLVCVGHRAKIIAEKARQAGLKPELVAELEDSDQAITFLENRLSQNDVVLIKGSRGMQMDRIVAALEDRP